MRARLLEWLADVLGGTASWLVPTQTGMVALGFLAASVAAVWLARRERLSLRHVALGLLACFVGAIFGSRILAALMRIDVWMADPMALLDLRSAGSASIGALAGGCIGFAVYLRRAGASIWAYADTLTPAAGVGMGFARLGCFVNGCDYGRVTSTGWGIRYPVESPAGVAQLDHGFIGPFQELTLPVHPLPLILAVWALLVFAVFVARPSLGRHHAGERALLVGLVYFAGRFGIEFLRSPWTTETWGVLSSAQWSCVAAVVALAAVRHVRRRRLTVRADADAATSTR